MRERVKFQGEDGSRLFVRRTDDPEYPVNMIVNSRFVVAEIELTPGEISELREFLTDVSLWLSMKDTPKATWVDDYEWE